MADDFDVVAEHKAFLNADWTDLDALTAVEDLCLANPAVKMSWRKQESLAHLVVQEFRKDSGLPIEELAASKFASFKAGALKL